jgi:Skp family chaperone for outer membrane proteins
MREIKWTMRTAGLALIAMLAIGMAPALAQKATPATAALVDSQKIFRSALAFKNAREQLDKVRAGYQTEVAKEEEKLRAEEQELTRQRAVLAPEAFDAKQREFQRRVAEVQRQVQERSRALEQSFNNARSEVGKVLVAIVTEMANERKLDLVLDRGQVVYGGDKLDITDEVLKRLDQRLPNVKVTVPTDK